MGNTKIVYFTFLAIIAFLVLNFTVITGINSYGTDSVVMADSTDQKGQSGNEVNAPVVTDPNDINPPVIMDTTYIINHGKPPADQEPDTSKVNDAPEPIKAEEHN